MTALPFPSATPPTTLLLSFSEEEAEAYARAKHFPKGWKWIKDVSTFDGLGIVHVEFVGMHWRKREDLKQVIEEFERKRARGETR